MTQINYNLLIIPRILQIVAHLRPTFARVRPLVAASVNWNLQQKQHNTDNDHFILNVSKLIRTLKKDGKDPVIYHAFIKEQIQVSRTS